MVLLTGLAGYAETAERKCGDSGVWLQVLGSGGPELGDGRASSGYVIRMDGRARVLVDAGGGSALRFEQAGGDVADLDAILFTHLHVDHSADFPVYIKASYFGDRDRDLPVLGPTGNHLMPATTTFVQDMIGAEGAFRYLADYLDSSSSAAYTVRPRDMVAQGRDPVSVQLGRDLVVTAVPTHHGPIPALAWRIDVAGRSVTLGGDMSGRNRTLSGLARDTDILVAHNAVPEGTTGVAANLHVSPSRIGRIAADAGPGQLVLSHRMKRTLGREGQTLAAIRRAWNGPVSFSDDLDCFEAYRSR